MERIYVIKKSLDEQLWLHGFLSGEAPTPPLCWENNRQDAWRMTYAAATKRLAAVQVHAPLAVIVLA
jgi:hypothetical protein